MFCPKCGTQNPETGKFCRKCGTDLVNVSAALSGNLPENSIYPGTAYVQEEVRRRQDPNEVYGNGIKGIFTGVGFLVISIVLLLTNVANGQRWWWAMLFPGFIGLGKGIADYLKSQRMEKRLVEFSSQNQNTLNQPLVTSALPPTQTEYVTPQQTSYQTGELVPPSVVEETTRHLEINSEGETMTLPKK